MKKYLVFLILTCNYSFAQEVNVPINEQSIDGTEILRHTWKASWIAHPTSSQLEYGVFLFRKSFHLNKVPKNFIVYVSADNRYKLYVNGQHITNGPARGDFLNWRYESIDIAGYLKPGENIIASEVINYGYDRPLAQYTFQTAFILQTEDSAYDELNTGRNGWKVKQNKAYQPLSVSVNMVNGFYAAGPCDSVIAKRYPWGWNSIGFTDNEWETPKIAFADKAKQISGVGRGYIYGAGLHLVPRSIPLLEQKQERFSEIIRTNYKGMSNNTFISGNTTVVTKNTKVSFLLDQKYLTIGYPQLLVSKGNGSKIKITYAEALRDSAGNKGNRNIIEGKEVYGYYDVIYPDGGDNRQFEPLWLRTFRYVKMDIETGNEELLINDYYNVFTAYPFIQKAEFQTDDPRLTQIWDVAWRTARLCASETYFDCPYYEQLQYIGDTRIQALISLYVTGDDRLMRNAIELFDQSRISDGLTLSRYPTNYPQIIPTYSLMWVNMIHDYYIYRGDSLFISRFAQGIADVLSWFEKRIDPKTGMIGKLEWWNFSDYTPDFQMGIPDGVDDGNSAFVSLQYVYALQNAARIFEYLGQSYFSDKYSKLAEIIKVAVLQNCYDNTSCLIAETPNKIRFSVHTSLFAILTNTIEEKDQPELMKRILANNKIIQPTVYFKFYLFRCLQKTGMGDMYLDNLGVWYNMLNQGLTTFAETDVDPRSDCHAWSASPLFDFLHLVAGIQPASPGFKTVLITPNFGKLSTINAKFPHPKGDIILRLTKDIKNKISGYIELPEGLTGMFKYGNAEIHLNGSKQKIDL